MSEYAILVKKMRKLVDDGVDSGLGRVAATRKMFDVMRDISEYDPEKIFPGYEKSIVQSNYKVIGKISQLAGIPTKMSLDALAALLVMGQVMDKFNRKVWILMPRAAKYVPDYVDRHSSQRFYPYTALMIEAYTRTRSPKAWDTVGCGFGIRDQSWFEAHSIAYESILTEFGEAALPSCFK